MSINIYDKSPACVRVLGGVINIIIKYVYDDIREIYDFFYRSEWRCTEFTHPVTHNHQRLDVSRDIRSYFIILIIFYITN